MWVLLMDDNSLTPMDVYYLSEKSGGGGVLSNKFLRPKLFWLAENRRTAAYQALELFVSQAKECPYLIEFHTIKMSVLVNIPRLPVSYKDQHVCGELFRF
jgi:hypothetical protein